MTAEIICLADHRKPTPEPRYRLPTDLLYEQTLAAIDVCMQVTSANLKAARMYWPGGIDDLEWWR